MQGFYQNIGITDDCYTHGGVKGFQRQPAFKALQYRRIRCIADQSVGE